MSIKRHVLPFLVSLAFAVPNFIGETHAADLGQTPTNPGQASTNRGQAPAKGMEKNVVGVVGFKFGGYFPQSSELENFSAGGHAEAFVERTLSPNFGLGAAVGFFETNNTTNVQVSQGGTTSSVSTDQRVRSTYLILNATLSIPKGAFVPYVEGGIGYYFNNIKESSSAATLSKDDNAFGYHAGAGLNWYFTEDYYVGVGARYIWAKTNDLNMRIDGLLADVNLGIRY